MAVLAIIVLSGLVGAQWVLIWKLLDRLLIQAKIPALGPVLATTPPVEGPALGSPRKVFRVPVLD